MEVIILAGGLGTRLRSVVSDLPKCMAPVEGKPFLRYLLENLRRFDVSRVILSVGYLKEAVQDWVRAHASDYPWEFCFAVEDHPLGTGGGIRLASSCAGEGEVIVLNGDTFFDADLDALHQARRRSGCPIALVLKQMRDFDRYGTVELGQDGIIRAFLEKQYCREGLVNGGVYSIDLGSGILDGHPEKFSFETDVLEPCCRESRLCGLVQDGWFIDIGVPQDYARACEVPQLLSHPSSLVDVIDSLEGYDTLLLDRDGVLNRLRTGDYVKSVDEFEWLPGAMPALASAARRFKGIYIITNQRGVGRGVMSREDLDGIHSWMMDRIAEAGGRVDGIYVCTAVSESDPYRKPQRGMFDLLLQDHPDVDPGRCAMVGDSESDMLFARNCGIAGYIVK